MAKTPHSWVGLIFCRTLGRWKTAGKWRVHAIFQGLNSRSSVRPRPAGAAARDVGAEQFSDPAPADGCAPHEEESSWQSVHISSRCQQGDQKNARNPEPQAFGLTSETEGVRSIKKRAHVQRRRFASKRGRTRSRAAGRGLQNPQNCAGGAHDFCCIKAICPHTVRMPQLFCEIAEARFCSVSAAMSRAVGSSRKAA